MFVFRSLAYATAEAISAAFEAAAGDLVASRLQHSLRPPSASCVPAGESAALRMPLDLALGAHLHGRSHCLGHPCSGSGRSRIDLPDTILSSSRAAEPFRL